MIVPRRGNSSPPSAATAHGTKGSPPTVRLDQEKSSGRAASFARRHALFGAVLLAAAVVRVIVMLGFPGGLLYPDSAGYLAVALRLEPNQLRPDGYPAMLRLLEPFHSLATVTGIQHAMGLAVGVFGYALLRRLRLPDWGATLAMVPVLLSAYAIQIEHFLLSDTLFGFLVMIAVVLMMWWRDPPLWACALVGLLLAAAVLVRTQGIPLLIVFLACLLVRFAGWRTLASVVVLCAAFVIPVAGYAAWFDSVNGTPELTTSDGAFLYAEVVTFANCARIQPPADERRLCLSVPVSERQAYGPFYIWSSTSPIRAIPGGEFGNRADKLGLDFTLQAIRAQPLDYLRLVWLNFEESFLLHSGPGSSYSLADSAARSQQDYMFPAVSPRWGLPYDDRYFYAYDRAAPATQVVQPYAGWIRAYQRFIVVPGPLLALITLIGLAGLIVSWRRIGGPTLLPWLTGMALLVTPAAVAFDVRYLVCAIPPLCVAAAIGVQQLAGRSGRLRAEGSQSAS